MNSSSSPSPPFSFSALHIAHAEHGGITPESGQFRFAAMPVRSRRRPLTITPSQVPGRALKQQLGAASRVRAPPEQVDVTTLSRSLHPVVPTWLPPRGGNAEQLLGLFPRWAVRPGEQRCLFFVPLRRPASIQGGTQPKFQSRSPSISATSL